MVEKRTRQHTQVIEREGFGYKDLPKLDLEEEEVLKKFEGDHKHYKQIVKEVLEYYNLATNNDFILYIESLRLLDLLEVTSGKDNFVFKIPREKIRFVPSPESITRARRSLNFKGIGLPTNPEVFLKRMKRQTALRQYFRGKE